MAAAACRSPRLRGGEHRKLARSTTDKPANGTTAAMSGVEHRAQHRIVEQAEIVTFVEQQRMLTVGQRVKDRRRGHVVAAIGIGGQRFEQDQRCCLAAATYWTKQRQTGRDRVAAEDVAV